MPYAWFLDFDDTLVSGALTWALEYRFPRLIQDYQLPYHAERFHQAFMVAQERSNQSYEPAQILHDLFTHMQWPHDLEIPILREAMTDYQPRLFDDVLPFLERVQAAGEPVCVISNNNHASKVAESLGVSAYVRGVFTPKLCPGSQPKPHRSLWDYVTACQPVPHGYTPVIVGDDPWSDGAFAVNCGVDSWLVDRGNRFTAHPNYQQFRWVQSLLDIPLSDNC
ncbi:MAG: HAD family hydrolase [Anaerolineae bacterium]|nr:HAD family hydrolase [Anaerolineae bacterium]